ncbi:MAG: hypothetical protein GY757_17475 [bacterium]|nr:hypothetical protein [bacterium]
MSAKSGTGIAKHALICFLFLTATALLAVDAKIIYQIPFDYEMNIHLIDGNPYVCDFNEHCIMVYDKGKLLRKLPIPRGEGPGEFKTLQNIVFDGKHYHVWDRTFFRMSLLGSDWKLANTIKITSLQRFSSFLGQVGQRYLFLWATTKRSPTRLDITEHLGFVDDKTVTPLLDLPTGKFRTGRTLNLARSFPIVTLSGNVLYHAVNNEYRIHKVRLVNGRVEKAGVIVSKMPVAKIKLTDKLKNLQDIVFPKVNRKPTYPEYLPPLIDLAADGDLLAVVTNELLNRKIAKVDLFKGGAFKGSIEIPILYFQYGLFPTMFPVYYPTGTYLDGKRLFTFHYDEEEDQYKLVCRSLIF